MVEDPHSESAWKRGVSDATRIYGTISFRTIGIALALIFAGTAYFQVLSRETVGLIAAIVAALLFGGILSGALFAAPYRQRDEARQALKDCKVAGNSRRDDLAQVYAAGNVLLAERPSDYGDWLRRKDAWTQNTANFLRQRFGPAEEQMFVTPPTPYAADMAGSLDTRHNNQRLGLGARLTQLREILRHQDG